MWIETLSRHGEVAARIRVDGPEARIGRAYDNDVVIDDPHVAPHHLRIVRDEGGRLVAEDLGSVNGLYAESGSGRVARLALDESPGLRIGRTTLRVHDGTREVAPEKPITPPRAHASWAAGLGLALALGTLLVQWLNLTGEPRPSAFLLPLLAFTTALALWTGTWSLLSRVFFGQARFALQLRIALTAGLALLAIDFLGRSAAFAFALRAIDRYDGYAAWLILAVAAYAHLRAIATRHMNFAMGLVVALVSAGALLQYAGQYEARKLLGERASLGELLPPAFRLAPAASLDEFLRRAQATRRRVDEARLEEPPPGASEIE